jgi:hypothetical protein
MAYIDFKLSGIEVYRVSALNSVMNGCSGNGLDSVYRDGVGPRLARELLTGTGGIVSGRARQVVSLSKSRLKLFVD